VGLVAAMRAGRRDASAALFDRYGKHVQRVLASVLGPDQELSDLVQDVFVAALTSVDRIQDPRLLRGWLSSIAVFTARTRIRRRSRWRFVRLLPTFDLPEVPAAYVTTEVSEALRCTYRILDRMPADERIIFALRFVEGMDVADIASSCRVSIVTVRRRLARARARFLAMAREQESLVAWMGDTA
jgi:RNA polymerase sigma-70 factor (ECF subfamily)